MKVIDYYFSPVSPWTYLGHGRVAEMAARHGATINAKPVDYGVIFPVSGGLPLGKRAPQRQAYRLMELTRWRDHLGLPLTIQPKFFPVDGTQAAYLICGAPEATRMAVAGTSSRLHWIVLITSVNAPSRLNACAFADCRRRQWPAHGSRRKQVVAAPSGPAGAGLDPGRCPGLP